MWNKMPLSSNDVCVDFVNERMNRTQQRSKEETCEKSRSWAQAVKRSLESTFSDSSTFWFGP